MSKKTLNGLLDYLLATLTLDNRRWLAEHLILPTEKDLSANEKKTLKAIEDIESGKGIVCNTFDEFVAAIK